MRQLAKGKRLSPDKLQNQQYQQLTSSSAPLGVTDDKAAFLDKLSGIQPNYSGEYSPSANNATAGAARRVDFGLEGFNERLGAGMTPEMNPNDVYYANQGGIETVAKGAFNVASGAVVKALEGAAILGSAVGEGGLKAANVLTGGLLEKAGYDGTFDIDDITDNPLVKSLFSTEDWMKENIGKVYTPSDWEDKNFLQQVSDGAWWGNEGADGIAFALSNFIPAGILGKAAIGAKALRGIADLGEANAFTRFITMGKAGLLKGENALNFADRAVQTAFMTSSESLFEAKDTGDTFTNMYLQQFNESNPNTPVNDIEELAQVNPEAAAELREKKGDAMKHTFFANMAALSASNWIEAGLLNKLMGKTSKSVLASEVAEGGAFADPLERIKRKGLDKFFNNTRLGYTAKTVGQQMVTEGLYEENIQHAIQNVSQNLALKGKIDNLKFIEEIGKETFANLGDKEAWKSIGAGMVIGGLFGGIGAAGIPGMAKGAFKEKEQSIQDGIVKLNTISSNLKNVGQIYKEDAEGNLSMDTEKLQNMVANLVQAQNISEIHDYYKNKGQGPIADIVKNEQVANYVKGFMEAGLEEDLFTKIKDLKNFSEQDLIKLGMNPVEINEDGMPISSTQRAGELEKKVTDYIQQYKEIERVIPETERARQGEALSWYARYKQLEGLKSTLESQANATGINLTSDTRNPGIIDSINSLINKRSSLLAELPNQQRFSLPKRSESTAREVLLLEKEIDNLLEVNKENLEGMGITPPSNYEKINDPDETPAQKKKEAIVRTITQVNNAIGDTKDNYDALMSPDGGRAFYQGLASTVNDLEEQEVAEDDKIVEGDYITATTPDGRTQSGFVTVNELGETVFGNTVVNDNFLETNNVVKATPEEIQQLKGKTVEDFRKKQVERKINELENTIADLSKRIENGQEHVLKQLIEKEDIILNQANGTVRVTEKQFAKQLKQLEVDIQKAEDLLAHYEEQKEEAQNDLTAQQYLYDTEESVEDVQELIERTEEEIAQIEARIAKTQPILDRLKSLYFSMLNAWKSLFPAKEYKSYEERALEIEDAISRGVDPATFEEEGIGLANKLSDYTDYKQDLQLTNSEMKQVQRDLDEMQAIRSGLYDQLDELENTLASYKLEENKLNYSKPLRPEVGQKEATGNIPAKSKNPKVNPFADGKVRDVSKALFSTAGSHIKGDGLTTDQTQLRWYKFAESYNPVTKANRLRTVSINDPLYGVGKANDIFKDDAEEYKYNKHYKVLVVDKKGEPIYRDGELVFTSLPEPKENYTKNTNVNKWSDKKIADNNSEYQAFLDKASSEPQFVDIISRSNGIARKGQPISIKEAFGTEDIELKVMIDSGVVGEKNFPLHKGLVYAIQDGRPVGLVLRPLSSDEREASIERLKEYAKVRGDKNSSENSSALMKQITSTFFLGQRLENPELSIFFIKGENKLVFGDNIISHEDLIEGKYDIQLDQFLGDLNHHVDNKALNTKGQYRDVFGKVWDSYKEYLISERPDVPLKSDLVPKSDDINEPQFVNTYLQFSGSKTKETVPETKGKGKKKFSDGLAFRVMGNDGSISGVNQREPIFDRTETAQDSKIAKATEVVIPEGYKARSFEDVFNETETQTEDKLAEDVVEKEEKPEEEPTITIGKIKVSSSDMSSFKDMKAQMMADMLAEHVAEMPSTDEVKKDKDISDFGSDSLFDLDLKSERVSNYTPMNFEIEKQWFKDNISSTIPFRKVEGLIDSGAFGKFTSNAGVLISDAATAGTGYHEAFHVVSNLYLTSDEQTKLHNEWVENNKGQLESLKQSELYQGKSEAFIAEEELAEEFREFMLTNESPYKSWFSKLVSFMKGLLGLSINQKEELFKRIKKGAYKETESLTRSNITMYSRVKGLGATANKELMDGMTVTLFANLFKNGFDITDINNFNNSHLGEEKFNKFADIYNDTFKIVMKDIVDNAPAMINRRTSKEDFVKMLTSRNMKAAIIKNHTEVLKQFDILFGLEDDRDITNLPEGDRGRDTLGIVDSIEFSTKNGMPQKVKILIASLPQVQSINGKKSVKRSSLGLLIPTDYRRNVSIIHNELAGVSSFEKQVEAIRKLSDRIPEMSMLANKLDTKDTTTEEGFYLQSQFRQQFDKNRFTFFMQLYDGKNSYMIDANSSRMVDLIKAKWQGALRRERQSIKIENGDELLNEKHFNKYNKLGDNIREKVLSFYKDLGITFSNPEDVNIDSLADTMQPLMKHIMEGDAGADIINADGIKGYINRIVEQEVKTSLDYSDNQHINPEGKTVYNISLNDYLSIVSSEMNDTGLPTHLQWDELTGKGNPLMRHSRWGQNIQKGKKIQTSILEGARIDEVGEQGKSTSDLTRAEAAVMQITSVMKGIFPFLRAGDKALEKGFTFGEEVSEFKVQEANEIMRGYMSDEMLSAYMLNVEGIGADVAVYNKFGKTLRVFEGVLSKKDLSDATKIMNNSKLDRTKTIAAIDKFIERDSVKQAIDVYLDSKIDDNIAELIDNRILFENENGYTNLGLPEEVIKRYTREETEELSKGQVRNIMSQFTFNSLIANIEQTKMYTGDIAFFKDFFKRTSGLVGTGKTAWVGEYADKMLNTLFPRTDKQSNSKIDTWIFNEVEAASATFNEFVDAYVERGGYTKAEAEALLGNYLKNEEADAQGYVTLPEYREFNLRMGDWNNDREEVYQKALEGKPLSKSDNQMLNPEKPQMYAPQEYDELYAPTFYKLSIMPLIPSVIKGTTLETLNNRMLANGVGISMFASANKVGAKNTRDFYNAEGTFNTANEATSHTVNYKYFKKQLDIDPSGKSKVIFGTQFRKLILSGLMGKVLTFGGKKIQGTEIIKQFNGLVDKQVKNALDKLINELGIVQDGNNFKIQNPETLKLMLKDEAMSRNSPDNMLESFDQIFKQGDIKPVELSVNRNKIEQILMSLVNNNVIKQKVRGGSLVQAASTGFESKPRRQSEFANKGWASNLETLQFYRPSKNGTLAMEVYLPYKFKEVMGIEGLGNIDPRLKQLIAFRIPTQGLNSIEAITVKGFLPREAGDIIMVPTEGVTKSGWDFDVDKLNVFYPNYSYNKETKTVEYLEDDTQNQIIELSRQILLANENFISLTTPNTTQDLLNMEKEIASLNPALARNDNERSKFVDWAYNLDIRQTYLLGKSGVGQAALQNVNHVMSQIAKLGMKNESNTYLKHHKVEGLYDLSQELDVDGNKTSIQDIISQTLNGFVDIARDPFLKTLNITPTTSNLFFFLTRIGTPLRQNALFLNQPIIRDYLKELESNSAMFLDSEQELSKKNIEEKVIAKWSGNGVAQETEESRSEKNLASYIKDGGKNNAMQVSLFQEFLDLMKEAESLSDLIQAVNFDTSSSSSIENAKTKVETYFDLMESEKFTNLDKMLSETFLGSFAKATEKSINLYKDLFITESNDGIRNTLANIKNDVKEARGVDKEKFMNTAKNDMISYLIQNSKIGDSQTKLGNFINAMFVDKSSNLATAVASLKDSELGDNYFIRELSPILSRKNRKEAIDTEDVNNLKMFTKKMVTEEQNLVTDAWRELFEYEGTTPQESNYVQGLANDLMVMAILQSGLNNSPLSFTQFIPNEYYFSLSSTLIDNAIDDNIDLNSFRDKFYKNNVMSSDIVPRIKDYKTKGKTGLSHYSARPYVKTWNSKKKSWKLYRNTYIMDGKSYIFEQTNKLGDGFNFKEYASPSSVLASNNVETSNKAIVEKGKTTKNKLIAQVRDSSLNDATQEAYIKRINEAKDIEEVADIVKDLCS